MPRLNNKLCEEAGPALVAAIQSIEMRLSVRITEVRVTFEASDSTEGPVSANCTIVCADETSVRHDTGDRIGLAGS